MLKREIEDTELEYARMMAELELLDRVKEENKVTVIFFVFLLIYFIWNLEVIGHVRS